LQEIKKIIQIIIKRNKKNAPRDCFALLGVRIVVHTRMKEYASEAKRRLLGDMFWNILYRTTAACHELERCMRLRE